jgi:hypothetical protein
MRVWVAERGCYSGRSVVGVYATAQAAMDDNPIPENYKYPTVPTASNASRRGGWRQDADGWWSNGLDWDDAVDIEPYELQGADVFTASDAVDPQACSTGTPSTRDDTSSPLLDQQKEQP